MPLQNRVDPFGTIHAVADRGMFTGNRGIIHDPDTRTLLKRRWSSRAWITCLCTFRDERREVMGPGPRGNGSWTELFFLDEVAALAAGHRPCFCCRRADAAEFARIFGQVTGNHLAKVRDIDARLHTERLAAGATPETVEADFLPELPDGVMVSMGGVPYAMKNGNLLPWSFSGYGAPMAAGKLASGSVTFVTPKTVRAVLAHGYRPVWHPTAGT